jgi:hypothetical protein
MRWHGCACIRHSAPRYRGWRAPLPTDLSDFDQPAFVVVVPFAHTEAAKPAA